MDVLARVHEIGVVPVVVLNKVEDTASALDTLIEGDVPVAEICFRTPCAADCIRLAAKEYGEKVLVGAGTVINAAQCEEAIACGAKFIVSPGFSKSVCDVCKKHNVPYLPGVVTPTEIMEGIENGITTFKFFPAGVFGGLKAIKALAAAFPACKFMPTGGVDNSNIAEFVKFDKIVACGGSWVLKGTKEEQVAACLEARKIIKENRK